MQLKIQNLTAGYPAGPDILHGVDLHLRSSEIITVIGPNGAGKSTILRAIFNLAEIRSGQIFHAAREITNLKTDQIIRSGVALVSQGRNIFPDLTVDENLEMGAFVLQNPDEIDRRKTEVFKIFPTLKKFRQKKSGILSGGERQMIAIGMGLMTSPEVICLDEPSIGLAPRVVAEVFEKIRQIRDVGTSVLMIEQNAATALQISDRGYALELGKVAIHDSATELLKNPKIRKLYLGG